MKYGDERLPQRFWDKVSPEPNTGCWLWTGNVTRGGYGHYWMWDSDILAHRVSYSTLVGTIEDGLHVDHLCRTRSCVNPCHLEPVTPKENTRRGISHNASKTHCKSGHEFTHSNTLAGPTGRRTCRTCLKIHNKATAARRKEERRKQGRCRVSTKC